MYICGVGIVWTIIQGTIVLIDVEQIFFTTPALIYGFSAGLALCFSNILLLESLKHIDISAGATIYRLNTVGVVIFSISFLQELIGWIKGFGILLGILAVVFLYEPQKGAHRKNPFISYYSIAILASMIRAIYGVVTKAGLRHHADPQLMLIIASACWIVGGILYAVIKERTIHIDRRITLYAIVSGILVFCIVFFLTYGLKHGEATIVLPIANMSFLVAILLAALCRMEKITVKKGTALFIASGAILCLSLA